MRLLNSLRVKALTSLIYWWIGSYLAFALLGIVRGQAHKLSFSSLIKYHAEFYKSYVAIRMFTTECEPWFLFSFWVIAAGGIYCLARLLSKGSRKELVFLNCVLGFFVLFPIFFSGTKILPYCGP